MQRHRGWREFYADVLWHRPETVRRAFLPAMRGTEVNTGPGTDEAFLAWAEGHTGYPFVDAGMRQLLAEGWMHNRVRMITASFLVKDLPSTGRAVPASSCSTWSTATWRPTTTAGNGRRVPAPTPPYFRIFNPVTQGER